MSVDQAFAVWITGLPATGKSAVARELVALMNARSIFPVSLESDALRKILTPEPRYTSGERDRFYLHMALLGELITRCGVPVIFDATANLRIYRDRARALIPRFIEVFISTPIDLCRKRDPKGIYASAAAGTATNVPGVDVPYERPSAAELIADGSRPAAETAVQIMGRLNAICGI
jgi:adenylylsulfate kinase